MTHDALAQVLPFLVADGCELVVALGAFLDESDRTDGTEPICVAGYIFHPGAYGRFARQWRKFLKTAKPGGLSHLHMTDLYAGRGDYAGLNEKRGPIFGRAVEIIKEHVLGGVAVLFEQKEFEAAAPPWYAVSQGSIYSTACQICMRATAHWLRHRNQQLVTYTFETGHKFQHEANAILNAIATAPDMKEDYRYLSHGFADKKKAAGLQAADILAWTVARTSIGFPSNRTMALLKPHILSLSEGMDKYAVQVFTGDKLKRFFAEQLDRPGHYYFKKPPEFRGRLR